MARVCPACFALFAVRAYKTTNFLIADDHHSYSYHAMMMMTFITQRGESQGKTKKERKATKSKGRGLEEGASRALMRQDGEEGCGERG